MRKLFDDSVLLTPTVAFDTLSEIDRCALRRWIIAARAVGIDAVEDLTRRRWPATIAGAVIGVFMSGNDEAAWLAVGQNGYWAIASCIDGSVSSTVGSLADALALVYETDESSE